MPCCQPTPSDDVAADQRLRPASPGQVRAALTAAAELGLFFGLADPDLSRSGWLPVRLLYADQAGALDGLIEATRALLGGCERRVATSLLFQGYAARLLSPQVGCLVTSGCLPAIPAARLSWRRPDAQAVELGLHPGPGWRRAEGAQGWRRAEGAQGWRRAEGAQGWHSSEGAQGWQGPADALIELMLTQSFDEHLDPLSASVRARSRLPASLLRDNAASALIGAFRLIDDKTESGWRHLADVAFAHQRLRGSGTISPGEPAFVRRSCCLYYRVGRAGGAQEQHGAGGAQEQHGAAGGTCSDCPLTG